MNNGTSETFTLTGAAVVTLDDSDSYYPSGMVVVSGGRIARIGSADSTAPEGQIIDMSGKVLMPGLVNAHIHSVSPLFRSMADDLRLMDWLKKVIWPAEKHLTEEAAYWGASLSFLELAESGVTTCADQYFFSGAVGRAADQSGLRCFMAPTIFSGSTPESDRPFDKAREFIETYAGREEKTRVYPCLGPHAPYSCTREDLLRAASVAQQYGVLVHIHLSETEEENAEIRAQTGLSPAAYLESVGLFDGPALAAHCVHLDSADMKILRRHQVGVAYNPISNLKLVSGTMPLAELLEHGLAVGIGTDGAQSNNSLDLLADLKTGSLMQKQLAGDAAFFPARDALRMVTIEGAKTLRMEAEIGSLEPGKRADIIGVDLSRSAMVPLHTQSRSNVYSMIVYSATGADVCDALVEGEWVVRDRKAVRVDRAAIHAKAAECANRLMTSAGLL